MCLGMNPAVCSPLQRLLPPGCSRFIAQTPHFAAVPTFGCFVAGYLLVVPRTHVLSFARLGADLLAEAGNLVDELAVRIETVYGMPVLGFEAGINQPHERRIEHAHWHLLPSQARLREWLDARLPGRRISSLTELPADPAVSYIAVRDQERALTAYVVDGPLDPGQRIRLRRTVAALDPRVDSATWDWAGQQWPALIRQTVQDLGPQPPGDRT